MAIVQAVSSADLGLQTQPFHGPTPPTDGAPELFLSHLVRANDGKAAGCWRGCLCFPV